MNHIRIDPVGIVMLIWFIWAGNQYIKQEQELDKETPQNKVFLDGKHVLSRSNLKVS